jgi:hypothetical protein
MFNLPPKFVFQLAGKYALSRTNGKLAVYHLLWSKVSTYDDEQQR